MMILSPILWFFYIALLSYLTIPIWQKIVPALSQIQLQLIAKPLSFFIIHFLIWNLFAFTNWIGISFTLAQRPAVGSVLIVLLAVTYLVICFKLRWKLPAAVKFLKVELLLFLLFFSIYLLACSISMPIWGEKPMDMGMLQSFLRAPDALKIDPWMVGEQLHYYYFGYFINGFIGNILMVKPSEIYLLAHSFNFFLYISVVLAALWKQGRSTLFWLSSAISIVMLTNFSAITSLLTESGVSAFWHMTRLFIGQSYFIEFPLWSFVLADFHPHYIAYPLSLLSILYILKVDKNGWMHVWLMGVILAVLLAVNSWDFLFICTVLVVWIMAKKQWHLLLSYLIAFVLCLPWLMIITGGQGMKWGMQNDIGLVLFGVLKHQGIYLILISTGLLIRWRHGKQLPIIGTAIYILGLLAVSTLFFMDPLNTIFKFGGGLTLLGTVLIIGFMQEVRHIIWIGLITGGIFFYTIRGYFHAPNNHYLAVYGEEVRTEAGNLSERCKNSSCLLLEWPGGTYDYSRMQLSSLSGVGSYIGPTQHLMVRNAKEKRSSIMQRRNYLSMLFTQVGEQESRKVYLCRGLDLNKTESLELLEKCKYYPKF